jgi:hypothetical protein
MKFKKIVGFGDSWMWGDELFDPNLKNSPNPHPVMVENTPYRERHCFLGLLGKHYNVPTENFGIPGGSQQSAMWTYLWWLEHEKLDPRECLILVGHTESNRDSFYNPEHVSYGNDPLWNKFIHSAWVHSGASCINSEWSNMVKTNMVLTDCEELQILTYKRSVLFFEGQSYKLGNNLLQFTTMGPPTQYGPKIVMDAAGLIWPDSGLMSLVCNNPDLITAYRHPNERGHEVIRDHLIPEIERVTLA